MNFATGCLVVLLGTLPSRDQAQDKKAVDSKARVTKKPAVEEKASKPLAPTMDKQPTTSSSRTRTRS